MTSTPSHREQTEPDAVAAADAFYAGAVVRIMWVTLVVGLLLVPLVWLRYGAVPAGGFLLGAAISYLNFYWLARAVRGLAGRIIDAHSGERGSGIVVRFLVRYLLIGLATYVTFKGWSAAVYGLLTGLCLPVAGMMAEAACEAYVAVRRGL